MSKCNADVIVNRGSWIRIFGSCIGRNNININIMYEEEAAVESECIIYNSYVVVVVVVAGVSILITKGRLFE